MRILVSMLLMGLQQLAFAQTSESYDTIIMKLRIENQVVVRSNCTDIKQEGQIVTNRALNLFFANKIAGFLSEEGDISLFGSYATVNTEDGRLNANHNFWVKKNAEERIRRMTTLGIRADISDGFASIFSDKKFNNDLGLSFKQTWLHRGTVSYDGCSQRQRGDLQALSVNTSTHKSLMDVKREMILRDIEQKNETESIDFEARLDNAVLPDETKSALRQEFYANLNKQSQKKFAEDQYKAMTEGQPYRFFKTSWTSVWGYIPVTSKKFTVAYSYTSDFSEKKIYPLELNISRNWLRESKRNGSFFYSLGGALFQNSSINTGDAIKINDINYAVNPLSTSDTLRVGELSNDEVYLGEYKTFLTPVIKGQFVWFPVKFFAGISFSLEKNFGNYSPLNAKFGIPMRFRNKDGDPTFNLELQLRSADIGNNLKKDKTFREKTAVGVSVSLPFGQFLY